MTRNLLAVLILLLLAAARPAPLAAAELPVLDLHAGKDAPPLAPFVRFARQTESIGTRPPASLLAGPLQRIEGPTIHFGPPGSRTAVLLKIRNISSEQGSWILTTGRGSLKYFRLYRLEGDAFELVVDGTDPEAARRNLGTYQAFSTELVLDPAEEEVVLIEFLSENSTYMPLRINSYGTFFKERRANIAMVSGVVVGALTLLLLNFLFFSITGFREFLWLAVAEAFFALNTVHSEGYITIFFLYDKPLAGLAAEDFIKCGFAASMAQFCRVFVKTAAHFPRRDMVLKALIWFALAIMAFQPGLALYPPELRLLLHIATWLVTVAVALFLPFVGYAAMKQLGFQLWPLFVGWASLALFIIYAAIASMGIFTWLPVNWHLAGPVGLFEAVMVTLALGLNLRKIQRDKVAADWKYAQSLTERLEISERAARLAEEKAFALETVNSQNALLHASGHDSRQVILALNSAVEVLKREKRPDADDQLVEMLESSADYLNKIISTTISGANLAASDSDFVALSSFRAEALVEPLSMMFKTPFAGKKLTLDVRVAEPVTIISDRPLLMRALANLLSNSYKFTDSGGASITLAREQDCVVITVRDSGGGMPADLVAQLNDGAAPRIRAGSDEQGTGSGFGSARRIVEMLCGSMKIVASGAAGTEIRIVLPAAFASVTPVSTDELGPQLGGWTVLDFDDRAAFEAGLSARPAAGRTIALTYDDTTVTRGRLSQLVAMMAIKPACRELALHPLLNGDGAGRSEQV